MTARWLDEDENNVKPNTVALGDFLGQSVLNSSLSHFSFNLWCCNFWMSGFYMNFYRVRLPIFFS